ncbi:MAG: protease complex subunit PrcB family protein [Bernardetiaceae bacterium]|nr:protease complex subunit PrcB family protein [Bernardetiaceae bacterium]
MQKLLIILSLIFFMSSCKSSQNAQGNLPRDIDFENVLNIANAGPESAQNLVIRDAEVLENIAFQRESRALNEVDFDKHMLIMVASGQKSNGGYGIEIIKITEHKKYISVHYENQKASEDQMVTMALVYPVHVVAIPKSNKEVRFEGKDTIMQAPNE